MKIRNDEPALFLVKECKAPIKKNVFCDIHLAGQHGAHGSDEIIACHCGLQSLLQPQVSRYLRFVLALLVAGLGASCTTQPDGRTAAGISKWRVSNVRTTAYTHSEEGGRRNAIGSRLSGSKVISAASDWSRFPLGTKFRIVDTNEVFQIDDYGSALIGTNTIDLYKISRLEMRRWGMRHVDIDILEWGSNERSLAVLAPRSRISHVRRMVVALREKKPSLQPSILKF
jgi:3D (Asp-Asp-Asp) domain-containing protein